VQVPQFEDGNFVGPTLLADEGTVTFFFIVSASKVVVVLTTELFFEN